MKKLLIPCMFFMLLAIPNYAITIELKPTFTLNPNFTKEYKMTYSSGIFSIGKISITPTLNISGNVRGINPINDKIILNDNNYTWSFGLSTTAISLNNLHYVAFDIKGVKGLDDLSFTDGVLRFMFDDLADKGDLRLINDSRIILYNPTSLIIDPTIQLLGNSTNKFYKNTTAQTSHTFPSVAITEFSDTEYNSTNITDNNKYSSTITALKLTARYKYLRYSFNLSSLNVSTINWLRYCEASYYTNPYGDGTGDIYYLNVTSNSWKLDQAIDSVSETTLCKNFTNITSIYNSTSKLFQFGNEFTAIGEDTFATITTFYVDFINLTIDYTLPSTDTCTYSGSGNWNINIADNCNETLITNNVIGNIFVYGNATAGYLILGKTNTTGLFMHPNATGMIALAKDYSFTRSNS